MHLKNGECQCKIFYVPAACNHLCVCEHQNRTQGCGRALMVLYSLAVGFFWSFCGCFPPDKGFCCFVLCFDGICSLCSVLAACHAERLISVL